MSDDESCPLCLEALDATDKKFRPCPCGYQMCLYCFNRVNSTSGRCPACRSPYSITERDMTRPAAEVQKAFDEEQSRLRELKEKERENRERKRKQDATVTPSANGFYTSHPGAEILQTVRVRQRNLVYVTGLSPIFAKEEILKKKEYFGRFGRILKVSINRKPLPSGRASSMSAYITFKREQDAMIAIKEMNQAVLDGRMIKASYGTTKYCSSFLQHTQCTNPGCLYLHDLAKEADCYTKDDLNGDRFIEEPFVDMQKRGLLTPDQSPTASQPSDIGPPPLMHLNHSNGPGTSTLPPARPQGNASAANAHTGGGMPTIPHIQISSGGSMSNAGVGSLGVGVTTPLSAIVAGTAGTGGGTPVAVAPVGNGVAAGTGGSALPGSSPVVRTMAATLQQLQHMPVVALNSQHAFPALGTDPRQHSQLTNGVSRRGSNSTNAHNHSSSIDGLHTSGGRGSSSSKQPGASGPHQTNHKHQHFPQPSPRGGSVGPGPPGGAAGNPPGLLSGCSFFANVTPTFRDRVSGSTSRDSNSHADPSSHSSLTPSSMSSHPSQHQVPSHAHAHPSSSSSTSSTVHALNAQNRPKPSRSPPGLVQKPVVTDKNSGSLNGKNGNGNKKGRSSGSYSALAPPHSGKHTSNTVPPNGMYGVSSQKSQKRPNIDLMSTLVLAHRTAVDIEKVLARCDFGADFDSVLSEDLKLMSMSSAQMTRGMPPARVTSSYTASRFAFATCDELTDARAPASLSVGIGGSAPSLLAVPTRPLPSASSSLSAAGISGVAQRQRAAAAGQTTQSRTNTSTSSASSLMSSALSSIARSSDLSPSAMPFLSNSSIGAMTDDIRGQVQSFLGPPHSSSRQQTTSSLSTAASPFTSTAAATGLSLLNTTGGNGRQAPASPMHAHGGQAPHGVQSHLPRGEAAFFEPDPFRVLSSGVRVEPDASLYGSLPVAAALGGRLSQGSHAAAGAGRFGAGGDPYAADDSRGSSYHLFNNPSPRHAQRSRGQRGDTHGSLGGGPSLSLGMTSLTRGQSAGTENKSSSSLLADRFDSYSSAFGAHDAFSGNSNAAGSSNADYSGAVSGNLSLNFPPGLGGGQNGPAAGSQNSLLGRAGSASERGGQRGAAAGGGFGDDILGGSSSAWRMQPHEQKMPQQQQGPSAVGGHRGPARGTIGGPAPPRQPHMDRNGLYGGGSGNPPSGRGANSSGSAGMGDFGGQGGFPSLYPTSKRPRSRYDFYGQQHGGS